MIQLFHTKRTIISISFLIGFLFISTIVPAQLTDICEGSIPSGWKSVRSKISMSTVHYKTGKESILWKWTKRNASLQIRDTAFASVAANSRSAFVIKFPTIFYK